MGVRKLSNIGGWTSKTSYTSMLAGNAVFEPWAPSGAYDSIATTTLSTATASITFSSIPATYTHLQIRYTTRLVSTGGISDAFNTAQFNGDTANNYSSHYVLGDGASTAAGASTTSNTTWFGFAPYGPQSTFSLNIIDILDYANTNKYKTTRTLAGNDRNGAGVALLASGLWRSSAAITSLVITPGNSFPFAEYSSFALYGIKGA